MRGLLLVAAACALAGCGDGPDAGEAEDSIAAIVTAIDTQADSTVRAAMTREGLDSFDAPAPGLGDQYFRAPRRHGQVKRHYEAWLRVDAGLRPSLLTTMRTTARRLEIEADLNRIDAMNLPVFVGQAVQDREWELELRKQLADLAVTVYEQDEVGSAADGTIEGQRVTGDVADRSVTISRNHLDRITRQLNEVMTRRANQYGLHDRATRPGGPDEPE